MRSGVSLLALTDTKLVPDLLRPPPPRITHILALQPSCYLQSDSYTALHHAAQLGYSDVVAALLTCGADPNKVLKLADGMEFDKFTALHVAASLDHAQVVEALVEHGASVNQTAVRALVYVARTALSPPTYTPTLARVLAHGVPAHVSACLPTVCAIATVDRDPGASNCRTEGRRPCMSPPPSRWKHWLRF
jgi:hypothetical protein